MERFLELFVQKLLERKLLWKKHFNRKEVRKFTIHDTIYQGERCRREKIKWENLHQDLIPAHILGNFYIYFSWQEKTAGGAILTPIGVKKLGSRNPWLMRALLFLSCGEQPMSWEIEIDR